MSLAMANAIRSARREQRLALRALPAQQLVRALIDPPSELASYRLGQLFVNREPGCGGVIPGFNVRRLDRALAKLRRQGYGWADSQTRLRQLSLTQRRLLMRAVLEMAPAAWAGRKP